MPLKDIFVYVRSSKTSKARMAAAVNLAAVHQAHVTSIYVPRLPKEASSVGERRVVAPQVLLGGPVARADRRKKKADKITAEAFERVRLEAERTRERFFRLAERAGVAASWHYAEGQLFDVLIHYARFCDVLMMGQPATNWRYRRTTDQLIISMGLPVMVVPPLEGSYPPIGQRIMIAWDRSPVATRAVNNARPFLREAKAVKILSINLEPAERGAAPGSGITEHLVRHDIKAEPLRVTVKDPVLSDVILSTAAKEKIDLLVMGAYGNRGLRERILGGVTSHVIDTTTVPVLLSH